MSKRKTDRVTADVLDVALRMCHIQIHKSILEKIIDLIELIEQKGDEVSIKDISELKNYWEKSKLK